MAIVNRVVCAAFIAFSSASHAQTCGREVVFDISPFEPTAVAGELIAITPIQGNIVHAKVDAVFVSKEQAEWSMYANFEFPTGVIGADSITGRWSGVGTFNMTVESDALNGLLVSPTGFPFVTWYLTWAGGTPMEQPGGGIALVPMNGYFEQLTLTLTLADCPIGDLDANLKVDVDDLLILINNWGACPPPEKQGDECQGDITSDGAVDVDDLLEVIEHWGNYWCPPPIC